MATVTLTKNVTLTVIECPNCSMPHAIPEQRRSQCQQYGGYWYCPNGHHIGWDKRDSRSETDKLEAEIAKLQSKVGYQSEQLESERRRVAATKGEMTKLKNRIANGVCPCCHRSFQNLKRHIASKHPEMKEQS